MSAKPRTNKKQRGKKLMVSMGDTVKLTKGRVGLIRFIGKTQFGLGEWIGIELYNELIKTRHNGAVLGKRYFRCPPHRGVFIRRSIIRENIAVLDIQPSIKKLRAKETKMKNQRKSKNKQMRDAKKLKNEKKREAKRLKIQAKYANTNKPISIATKPQKSLTKRDSSKRSQTPTSSTRSSVKRSRSANRTSTPKGRSKSPNISTKPVNTTSFQMSKRKQRPRTPTDPTKKSKKRSKTPTTGKTNAKTKKKKQSKDRTVSEENTTKQYAAADSESEEEEFPSIPNIMSVAEPMIARQVKVKYKSDLEEKRAQKGKAYSTDLTKQFKSMKKKNKKERRAASNASKRGGIPSIKKHAMIKSKTAPDMDELDPIDTDGVDGVLDDESKSNSPSYSRDSIDIPIFTQGLNRSGTAPQIHVVNEGKQAHVKSRSKVSMYDDDGVRDSDDSSLNDEEELERREDEEELKRELEEDFEKNFEKFHDFVEGYVHKIEEIETERKILANKVVADTRRRLSSCGTEDGGSGRMTARQRAGVHQPFQRRKPNNLMVSAAAGRPGAFAAKSKQFDVARSRRGSSFVDEYNMNDTLFFDGVEESEEVHNADMMGMEDDEEDEEHAQLRRMDTTSPLSPDGSGTTFADIAEAIEQQKNGAGGGHATPVIMEEDEEEEETETENVDPLLGTIEDIIDETEYEEEEFKLFDLETETAMKKTVTFYVKLSEFIEWEGDKEGEGMTVSKINKNEYGKTLFVEIGIETGWIISWINETDIRRMTKEEIESEIGECEVENGYKIVFETGFTADDIDENINENDNLKPSLYMKSKKQSE
eukprot:62095_1